MRCAVGGDNCAMFHSDYVAVCWIFKAAAAAVSVAVLGEIAQMPAHFLARRRSPADTGLLGHIQVGSCPCHLHGRSESRWSAVNYHTKCKQRVGFAKLH